MAIAFSTITLLEVILRGIVKADYVTAVTAINHLTEMIVISDTRVSYPDKTYKEGYGLKKLSIIKSPDRRTILIFGFSGQLSIIKPIIEGLMPKILNYGRKFVIAHLSEEICKWIQEITTTLPTKQAPATYFTLSGLEPLRRHTLRRLYPDDTYSPKVIPIYVQ